jgi:hypothetical protein
MFAAKISSGDATPLSISIKACDLMVPTRGRPPSNFSLSLTLNNGTCLPTWSNARIVVGQFAEPRRPAIAAAALGTTANVTAHQKTMRRLLF